MDQWLQTLKKYLGNWPEMAKSYFIEQWGLDPTFAVKAALLYAALSLAGLNPRITSGFRDPAKQKALRDAWDRGERAGLVVRPAATSKHSLTSQGRPASRAIDMPCSDNALAAKIAKGLGLRAGLYFSTPDPGHFDMG